jgi:hypothetical protein
MIKITSIKFLFFSISFLLVILTSCSKSIDIEDLYGRWDYISIKNADPEDIMTDEEVKSQKPYIIFKSNNELIISWADKQISYGKFKMDGKMIRYTENLGDERTRDFPFLILKLSENELVFQTMEKNFTKVSAKKNANKF